MIREYFHIATRSLIKRRLRSWLTMIGIFIGIAAVVSLIGLGEGLRGAITGQFSRFGSDLITVQAGGVNFGPPGSGVVTPLKDDVAQEVEKVKGVKFAINRLLESGSFEFNDRVDFGVVGSVPSGEHRRVIEDILGLEAMEGRLLKDGDRNRVVLGNAFSDDDIFGKPVYAGDRILIQGKQFTVVGIAKKIGTFFLDQAIYMNDQPLRDLFDNQEDVSAIAVKIDKGADIQSVKEDIEKILRKERDVDEGEEDFRVELAASTLEAIDSTLFAVQLFVYIIAGVSLVVGGIGIMNTMYTSVVERTKEIGIMKSIGAKNKDIFYLFVIESGLLGLVGGIVGVVVGLLLSKGLAAAGAAALGSDLIRAEISVWLVLGSLLFSFLIGTIAGMTPAISASRLHPVDALRYAK